MLRLTADHRIDTNQREQQRVTASGGLITNVDRSGETPHADRLQIRVIKQKKCAQLGQSQSSVTPEPGFRWNQGTVGVVQLTLRAASLSSPGANYGTFWMRVESSAVVGTDWLFRRIR